jgi:hypothetical protein
MKPTHEYSYLKKLYEGLTNIVANTLDARSKIEYFENRLTIQEKEILNKYPFYPKVRFAFRNYAVLDIYKVFNPKEDYSIYNLINRAIESHSELTWYEKIGIVDLKRFIYKLDSKKDLVSKIKHIRDKHIAHLDIKYKEDIKIKLSNITELTDTSKNILFSLSKSLFNTHLLWDIVEGDHDFAFIEAVLKYHKTRQLAFTAKATNSETIDSDTIMNIIRNRAIT